jgi:hypothetical protein
MSIAKQLIGEPAPKPAVSETQTIEEKPVHAMDLIDALADQEFGQPIQDAKKSGYVKPSEGSTPGKAMKQGKKAGGKVVAPKPGAVKYGKK